MSMGEILSVAVTLFLVMDPLGNAPLFNAVLSHIPYKKRMQVIAREAIIALFIMLGSLYAGKIVLNFLSLSEYSLSISGGVLLFVISLRMIFPKPQKENEASEVEDPFIVPLAMPMIAGPSSISVLILMNTRYPDAIIYSALALFMAWLVTAITLIVSPYLLKIIGNKGARALERLMGMILVILATQMLLNGVESFIYNIKLQ